MTATREHRWTQRGLGGMRTCLRVGCTIIAYGSGVEDGAWQRKNGGHYRSVASEPISPCTGKQESQLSPERMTEDEDDEETVRESLLAFTPPGPSDFALEALARLLKRSQSKDAEIAALTGPERARDELFDAIAKTLEQRPGEDILSSVERVVAEFSALKAEVARLKPSGQVAGMRERLGKHLMDWAPTPFAGQSAVAELDRLAAKAQGYEAIRAALADNYGADGEPLERVKELLESEESARNESAVEQSERHRVEGERDAAVADNAALLRVAKSVEGMTADLATNGFGADAVWTSQEEARDLLAIIRAPHPGGAILKEHERALEVLNAIRTMPGIEEVLAPRDSLGSLLKAADELSTGMEAKP